jgi:hypothetical protein
MYSAPLFNLNSFSLMNSVSVCLLSSFTCWCWEHGSNNQLFLTLRKQITIIQKTDKKIHDMSSAINEIE